MFTNVAVARETRLQKIKESQSRNKIHHDKDSLEPKFQVGDTVLMSNKRTKKFTVLNFYQNGLDHITLSKCFQTVSIRYAVASPIKQ